MTYCDVQEQLRPLLVNPDFKIIENQIEYEDLPVTFYYSTNVSASGEYERKSISRNINPKMTIEDFIHKFKQEHKEFRSDEVHIKFQNRLFKNGTFEQMGIQSGSEIEIIVYTKQEIQAKDEGFVYVFWSIPVIMLAISFLVSGMAGKFSIIIRGVYVLVGSILGVPSFVMCSVGVFRMYSRQTHVAFYGEEWFGQCCWRYEEDAPLALSETSERTGPLGEFLEPV